MGVKVTELPAQTVGLFTVTTGLGLIVTTDVAVPTHPFVFPVTTYVVVVAGFAVTTLPVVALKFVEGVQLYVVPPLADSVADVPAHIVALLTIIESDGAIDTVDVVVPVQVPLVPVIV